MRVSVLGLGNMGAPIAERLLGAGHAVAVWNRTASVATPFGERGATVLARPAESWSHGEAAIVMLANDAAVESVVAGADGLLGEGARGRTIIDMSTISVDLSARIGARAAQAGAAFLRAPVTGNPSVVAAGNLGIIVSGPREAYSAMESLLRDVGPNLFYVGSADQARVVKLGLNLVLAGTTELMAEALVLAEQSDVDRATMLEVLGGSVVGSPFVKYKTGPLLADDYDATFTTRGLYKDLALALEAANDVGVPLPVTALVQQLLQGAIGSGMGDLDFMSLVPRLRREAGVG